MGRALKFNRDEAIELAMNELWRRGYEACSVKYISEQLGITRSSYYNAFGSREGLWLAAMERYFAQDSDKLSGEIQPGEAIIPAIIAVFKDVCRARAADPEGRGCFGVNSIAELVGVNEKLGTVLKDAVDQNIDRFESLLRQAVKNGEIENGRNLKGKAMALQSLLFGVNTLSKVVRDEKRLWQATRQTLVGLGLSEK